MEEKQSVLSKEFPKKLKQLRQNRGWSQGQLAQKVGADINRISKYERGVIWPTMEFLVRMAQIFEVSIDYLIRDETDLVINKVSNRELLRRLEKVNELSVKDQDALIVVLDAFIKKQRFEALITYRKSVTPFVAKCGGSYQRHRFCEGFRVWAGSRGLAQTTSVRASLLQRPSVG